LKNIAPQTSTDIPQLKLSDDLMARFSDLTAKVAPFQEQLTKFDQDMANARAASSLDAYMKALQSLSKSELVGATAVVSAKRVIDLAPTTDKLTEGLLMPEDADGWAFFTANPRAPFYPTSAVLDPEKHIYDQVVVDPNVHSVFRYDLEPVNALDSSTQTLYVQGEINGHTDGHNSTIQNVTDYNPKHSRDKLLFTQESLEGYFTALGESDESRAFRNCHFGALIDDSGTKFNAGTADAPIHQLLDGIVRDSKPSSLFKAYIFANAGQLLQAGKRDVFWGLQYTPALKRAIDQINRMDPPASGDWMVPKIVESKKKQWDALFSQFAKISYLKQGEYLRAVYLRVNQTGFDYVGFIDDKGNPQLLEGHGVANQLWGWDSKRNGPALLFNYSVQSQKYTLAASPLPMTPVFQFKGDPQAILQVVRQDQRLTEDEYKNSVEPFLPHFFDLQSASSAESAPPP
jgi:hypothetical protein